MMTSHGSNWPRFVVAAMLLAAAVVFLQLRIGAETVPSHKAMADFPMKLGSWAGRAEPLSASYLAVLGPGDFLTRVYRDQQARVPAIDLYIAYFTSQRAGDTIHSPKDCLPGAGWAPLAAGKMSLKQPDGTLAMVNRYILGKGDERLFVLYWYQAHGRVVASEYSAKIYLVADAIRMNRTDGALVRVLTPILDGRDDEAEHRAVGFANLILPSLPEYIPR